MTCFRRKLVSPPPLRLYISARVVHLLIALANRVSFCFCCAMCVPDYAVLSRVRGIVAFIGVRMYIFFPACFPMSLFAVRLVSLAGLLRQTLFYQIKHNNAYPYRLP